jgi:PII-like signaling protein
MPVVIELIDTDERIDAFIPTIERLRAGALVIRQTVQILDLQGVAARRVSG